MAFDKDAFLAAMDSMTVMELNDLVKAIEEKFGVSAAAMAAPAVGGGGAAAAPVEEQPRELSILERATAAFQSKSGLLTRATAAETALAEARESIATQATEIAGLQAKNAQLLADRDQAVTELAQIGKLLDQAKADAATAEVRALDIVATTGLRAADLPAAQTDVQETVDSLTAKMNATSDPKKRWDLSRQISALRWTETSGTN
jgi:large subunit ribosomal protein L7/L12